MKKQKNDSKTLMWSIITSAPGPLILGIALIFGKTSTQIADFVRRSIELLAIIMAYVSYKITSRQDVCDTERKEKIEKISNLFVGTIMIIGGAIMICLAFIKSSNNDDNVLLSLIIALLGVVMNTFFWFKYERLNKKTPNAIISVQARLYRAKSLVDLCVCLALLSIMFFPGARFSYYVDKVGSIIVSLYLIWCGIKTVYERLTRKEKTPKTDL